jgi:hypothetical protein
VGKPETKFALGAADIAARGAVQIASCTISGLAKMTLVNIHSRLGPGKVKVIPNLRRTFEIVMCELQDRFIVGGDLNTARLLGKVYPEEYLHAAFWDEVDRGKLKESLPGGLVERQSYWGHGMTTRVLPETCCRMTTFSSMPRQSGSSMNAEYGTPQRFGG